MSVDQGIFSLNAGEISRRALARVDLAKMRIASEQMRNFLPDVLGPTMLRPGTGWVANMPSDEAGWLGEFYFAETDKTLLVMTASGLRFLVNDVFLTRSSVGSGVVNGDFSDGTLTGWTDSDESGASSAGTIGWLELIGTGTNYAWRDQQVTVALGDRNKEHALRVVIARNTVALKVGTAQADAGYFDITLGPGTYSLAFTPLDNFWIRLGANSVYPAYVDSILVEQAGIVTLPVPYTTTTQFNSLRYDQSGDVIFLAGGGVQQRRIERRTSDSRSWGFALYQSDDGPFRLGNTSSTQITASATTGTIILTSDRSLFRLGHVGALWRLTHSFQTATSTLAGANQFTSPIRVSGLSSHTSTGGSTQVLFGTHTTDSTTTISSRNFAIDVTGTFSATVTLQRSFGEPGAWTDVESYTTSTVKNYDDALDNQIVFYRLGIKSAAYTSGSVTAVLRYGGASQNGIVRINNVLSETNVIADVLQEIGVATTYTDDWAEGEWSDYRGWPAAVVLHDGRLAWFPSVKAHLSVSDAFNSFDSTVEGDSGPINRTIATGGRDGIRWALSLSRLIVGTVAQEISIRASSLDEPLSPTAFTARACSTRGVAAVRPIKVGTTGIFVQRNKQRVFELAYDFNTQDFHSKELTRLKQEMCAAGVVETAVQMQPDTRVWFVLADGTCAVLTYDVDDEVVAWTPADTDGAFERVAVLPGSDEDEVYFIVRRTINGVTKRFIEKLAKRTEAQGGLFNKAGLDSHVSRTGTATTTISAPHLAGKQVGIWGDGAWVAPVTLNSSGIGTLTVAVSNYVAGLPVRGRIKTAKLAFNAAHGTSLTAKKRVSRLGLVMADVSWSGIRIGRDFDNMTALPATYRGRALTAREVLTAYDTMVPFNGRWDEDARVCIDVVGPHCCTIMGLAIHEEINEPIEDDGPPARDR